MHVLMIHAKWSSCVSTINFNGDPANFTHILLMYWWTNDRQPCSRGNAERQETCHFGSQLGAVKQLKAESSDVASYDCVVAFPILVSQFRTENAKIKKAQKTKPTSVRIRNYKNTRLKTLKLPKQCKTKASVGKIPLCFLIQEGKATTSAKGQESRRHVTS